MVLIRSMAMGSGLGAKAIEDRSGGLDRSVRRDDGFEVRVPLVGLSVSCNRRIFPATMPFVQPAPSFFAMALADTPSATTRLSRSIRLSVQFIGACLPNTVRFAPAFVRDNWKTGKGRKPSHPGRARLPKTDAR
jgi:hypothetical protein